jgi:hypothetical protein
MTAQVVAERTGFGILGWQRDQALKTLEAYVSEMEGRVFTAFATADGLEMPSENKLQGSDDADGAQANQDAIDRWYEENEHLKDMAFARGRVVEMAIAGLYHLWERRAAHMLRTYERKKPEVGGAGREMADLRLQTFSQIREEFDKLGWSLEVQEFYRTLNQLRLVTDAIENGAGDSMTRLWRKFPHLFWPYNEAGYPVPDDLPAEPAAVNTLAVTALHFWKYVEAVRAFWKALPDLDRD